MKKVFFANQLLSHFLLQEESPEIKDFLTQAISKNFKLILEPFKEISIGQEKVFLFVIEPAKLNDFKDDAMDDFLSKLDRFGLKVFKPEMVKEVLLNISFAAIDAIHFEVIIPVDIEYVHETKTGHRSSGDEYDGPFQYGYSEKKFPVINSKNQLKTISFSIDESYSDKHYPNRVKDDQYFLIYCPVDAVLEITKKPEPALVHDEWDND